MLATTRPCWDAAVTTLFVGFGYAHEIFHYLTAKLLNCKVELHSHYTTLYGNNPLWKVLLIWLAPSLAGLLIFGCWSLYYWYTGNFLLAIGTLLAGMAWQDSCRQDFADCFELLAGNGYD